MNLSIWASARGFLDLGFVGADAAIGDVVADRVVEQHGILRHDADGGAQAIACVTSRISWPSIVTLPLLMS